MKKKICLVLVLILILALSVFLVACNKNPNDSKPGDSTNTEGDGTAEATLSSISASMDSTYKVYVGSTFDKSKVTVKATYSDNTSKTVTDVTFSTIDTATVGEKTLTVTYQGKTTTLKVNVILATLDSISATIDSTYKVYVGSTFDTSKVTVKASYTDESEKTVTDATFGTIDTATGGEKTLTVVYEEKTATVKVNVIPVTSISATIDSSYKVTVGSVFDTSKVTVKASYADESEKTVTDATFSAIETAVSGEKILIVSYYGKSFTTIVNVVNLAGETRAFVQDVFQITGKGIVAQVEIIAGEINVNDTFKYSHNGEVKTLKVLSIDKSHAELSKAVAGEQVGLLTDLTLKEDIARGDVLSNVDTEIITEVKGTVYKYTEAEGGIKTPIFNNIKPNAYFASNDTSVTLTLPAGVELILPGETKQGVTLTFTKGNLFKLGDEILFRTGGKTIAKFIITNIGDKTTELSVGDTFISGDWEYKCTKQGEVKVSNYLGGTKQYIKLPYADSDNPSVDISYLGFTYKVVGYEKNLITDSTIAKGVIVDTKGTKYVFDLAGVINKDIKLYCDFGEQISDSEMITIVIGECENKIIQWDDTGIPGCWHYDVDGKTPIIW